MIKLKVAANIGGEVVPPGTCVALDPLVEARFVAAKNATYAVKGGRAKPAKEKAPPAGGGKTDEKQKEKDPDKTPPAGGGDSGDDGDSDTGDDAGTSADDQAANTPSVTGTFGRSPNPKPAG